MQRNANGRVAMGLHGYRISTGEYGQLGWSPEFWVGHTENAGWLSSTQSRRTDVLCRSTDGSRKTWQKAETWWVNLWRLGGFYYKGQQQVAPQADVLQNLQAVVTPVETRPKVKNQPNPTKELISSPVYFSNDQWQECLSSHGIIIDEKAKTLTIQSESTKSDMVYDLTDEELKALTNNSVKQVSVAKRLDILNNVIRMISQTR